MTHPVCKVHINDRGYTTWTYINMADLKDIEIKELHPAEHKLFTNDVFSYDIATGDLKLLHSSIRVGKNIPGVLVLKGSKTYGRAENGKLLYKCIPDDRRLPTFLIPYEMKNVGFSKVFVDHYCTFNFVEWNDKHPRAVISQMIGSVDLLDNFYEYQLYCKSLNASIQNFTKDTSKALKNHTHDAFIENISKKYPEIVDRTDKSMWHIFTIDPPNSLDYDDAFSIRALDNGIQ